MMQSPYKLLVFIILLGYVFSIVIYVLYVWFYNDRNSLLKKYILSRIFQSIPWFIFYSFSGSLNPVIESFANVFMYSGAAIEIYCMMSANNQRLKRMQSNLVILTVSSIVAYAAFSTNIILRVEVTTVFFVILYTMFFTNTIQNKSLKMLRITGWLALLFALANIIRGSYSALSGLELPLYTDATVQLLLGLVWLLIAYSFPLLFLFVLKERDSIKLQELINTKNKFFRIIGHDLKGPIGQMNMLATLLENKYKGMSNEKVLMFIREMKESSNIGYKLLENLLEWARSQTGTISFSPELLSLYELVEENIKLVEKQAKTKDIKITHNLQGVDVMADRNMINTVIRNLLSNAIKFTHPSGKVELSSRIEKHHQIISVQDTGIGISADDCSKLFKTDTDHKTLGTNKEKGTGIGLILCKEFIDKHNGKIWVESEVNKGSKFSFSIPVNNV